MASQARRPRNAKTGRLAMSIRAADTRELVGWVLHFGSGVQVVSPASFRDKIQEEARKIYGARVTPDVTPVC